MINKNFRKINKVMVYIVKKVEDILYWVVFFCSKKGMFVWEKCFKYDSF